MSPRLGRPCLTQFLLATLIRISLLERPDLADGARGALVSEADKTDDSLHVVDSSGGDSCSMANEKGGWGTEEDIQSKCQQCVAKSTKKGGKCKWCPFSMTCKKERDGKCGTSTYFNAASNQVLKGFTGDASLRKGIQCFPGHERDASYCFFSKIKSADQCTDGLATPPVHKLMVKTWGPEWHTNNGEKVDDTIRCIQWQMDWQPNWLANGPGKGAGTIDEVVGLWGCRSALLRQALLGLTRQSFPGLEGNEFRWTPTSSSHQSQSSSRDQSQANATTLSMVGEESPDAKPFKITFRTAENEEKEFTFEKAPQGKLGLAFYPPEDGNSIIIAEAAPGTEAARLGVQAGMKILALNGVNVVGKDYNDVAQSIVDAAEALHQEEIEKAMDDTTQAAQRVRAKAAFQAIQQRARAKEIEAAPLDIEAGDGAGDEAGDGAHPEASLVETGMNQSSSSRGRAASRRGSGDRWDVVAVTPLLCAFIKMKNAGACAVSAYGPRKWADLREVATLPNNLNGDGKIEDETRSIIEELEAGPIVTFDPGAGKSGSGFSKTANDKYKIKLALRSGKMRWGDPLKGWRESFMNEPGNLLQLIEGTTKAKPLKDHLAKNKNSLLNRYYGLVKIELEGQGNFCLLMQDATYNKMGKYKAMQKLAKSHPAMPSVHYKIYDLKGRSRSQNKISKTRTGSNGDWKNEQPKGQFVLSGEQCNKIRNAFDEDQKFLEAHNMIDYSLFVGVATDEKVPLLEMRDPAMRADRATEHCRGTPGEPFCTSNTGDIKVTREQARLLAPPGKRFPAPTETPAGTDPRRLKSRKPSEAEGYVKMSKGYTVSVIDYLNDKNFLKTHEMEKGGFKFKDYGQGVLTYLKGICPIDQDQAQELQIESV